MGEFLLVETKLHKSENIVHTNSFGLFVAQIYIEDFEMLGGKCY